MDGLSAICAGLGIAEEDDNGKRTGYAKGEYCLDNLKDLLRFLRRDDPEKRDVFKQVCKWNVVGKDLIPIIEFYPEDRNLVLNAVKVLVFLTMPVEPTSGDILQQIEYLWGLKSAITFSDTVPVIVSLLETPLENLESGSFTEDDWKLVQLVLTLFRNVLAIQDISTQQKATGSATGFLLIRDRFLELLFRENVMDLILVLSQHTGGSQGYLRQDNLLLLETYYHIFKGQDPELIAKAYLKNSKVEDNAEDLLSNLEFIMNEEQEKRKLTRFNKLSCYSQYTGTYTRITLDGSKALLKGNPSSGEAFLKSHKILRGPSKREIWDHREPPSTKNQILQLLDDFSSQFLMRGYNVLMQTIREDIDKEHQEIQSSDIIMFFRVAEFVTSYQYHKHITSKPSSDGEKESSTSLDDDTLFKGSICGPIAETLTESMFVMVISKWRYAFDALKQTNDYKFLSAAGSLAKVMIRMLDLVLKKSPEDSREPQTARVLLYKLFYDQTEEGMTHFLLNQIKSFDTHKQSKSDLTNLVEIMHVVLRLLENLQSRGTLRVSKKLRKKRKKTESNKDNVSEPSVDNVNIQNEVGSSSHEETADANMLEMETLANEEFDTEAFKSIRDSIKVDEPAANPANMGCNDVEMGDRNNFDDNGLDPQTDDSSDEQPMLADEVDFKVSTLVSALASNTMIQKLCWLLKFYKRNSITTNHYIITMLRRICDDLELSPMLYQLSLLTIFYDILEEQKLRPCREYEDIVNFLTTLIRRMLRKMKSYPLLFLEVLFLKTRKECHYISCGYMLNELKSIRNKAGEGQNGMTNGINGNFEDQKWVRRSLADALGDDDFETSDQYNRGEDDPFKDNFQMFRQNSGEGNRTAISDRDGSEEESDGLSRKGDGLMLSDETNKKVEDLYERYKDNPDCGQLIAGELDPDGDISKPQRSKSLKHDGLKLPAKSKMRSSDTSNQLQQDERDPSTDTAYPNLIPEKSSSVRRPLHSRKRVDAFSVNQEQQIKDLFEQFKDHKRCSYMIANALDSAGSISTAQVSRKLKQLGLVRPKQKKDQTSMQLRDDIISEIPSEGAGNSDDETLSSLKIRGKHKRNGSHYGDINNKKIARESPEDISDDELLSSVLAKTKKSSPSSDDEVLADAFGKNVTETDVNGSDAQVTKSSRDELMHPKQMGAQETDAALGNKSSDVSTETIGEGNPNTLDPQTYEEAENSQQPPLDDELADFDEDTEPVNITQENSAVRRQRRMVIDFEDDEE